MAKTLSDQLSVIGALIFNLEKIELAIETKKVQVGTITFNLNNRSELEARRKEMKADLIVKLNDLLKMIEA